MLAGAFNLSVGHAQGFKASVAKQEAAVANRYGRLGLTLCSKKCDIHTLLPLKRSPDGAGLVECFSVLFRGDGVRDDSTA